MINYVVDLLIIVFGVVFFINCWKIISGINEVIISYGESKRKDLQYTLIPFGVEREGKNDLWNGFSRMVFTEEGIGVSCFWSLKSVFIPWNSLHANGCKKKRFTNYRMFEITGVSNFTWLIPEKALNKHAGKWL